MTTILGGPQGGDSARQRKKFLRAVAQEDAAMHVNLTYKEPPAVPHETMYFTNEEAKRVLHPHNDAIVLKAQVANNLVKMVLIDNGSAADIVFKSTLERMNLGGLRPTPTQTPLFGFTGERVMTEGIIDLPVTFKTPAGVEVVHMVPFRVVDQESPYNVIIGRPTLNRIRAITSTYHLLMKFPTKDGIGIMAGDQSQARTCYVQGIDGKLARKMVNTISQLRDSVESTTVLREIQEDICMTPKCKVPASSSQTGRDPTESGKSYMTGPTTSNTRTRHRSIACGMRNT